MLTKSMSPLRDLRTLPWRLARPSTASKTPRAQPSRRKSSPRRKLPRTRRKTRRKRKRSEDIMKN
jgi:hypothetical protein